MLEGNLHPSRPQTAQGSACSSVTMLPHTIPDTHLPTVSHEHNALDREIADDEHRMEKYGGDDPRDPPEKMPAPAPVVPEQKTDQNMVDWDGPDDPANPQNFSTTKKWIVTAVCIILTLSVSFGSSAPASAVSKIILEFGINRETSYSTLTLYLLGFVAGPSLWGPGSELYGRRRVLMLTMVAFTLFHLGQALGKNIETFLITRFFCGFFGVAPFTISGGVIADVWPALGRGPATSLFSASTFLGPVLGPIVGGYIAESEVSWRWVVWVSMIFAGFAASCAVLFLPETYAPLLLLWKAERLRKEDPEGTKDLYAEHEKLDFSVRGILHRTVWRPFQMLGMEPILLLITIYTSLIYGVLYALFEALPLIFSVKHGFSPGESGLVFIGVGIGTTLGSLINYFYSRHYPELVVKWRGFPPPEERLYGAMIEAPTMVIGAFWLGWTGAYPEVHWAAPAVATIAIGMAISLIFISFLSYLVDTYLMYSASAFASNTVIRSLVAAAFPLFTVQMCTGMGINWASTLIGLVSLILAPMPFLFFKYGRIIRARSKFAPCIDLKIAKEMEESSSESEKQSA